MFEEEIDSDPKQQLKEMLAGLDNENASEQVIEQGIAAAVQMAQKTAIELELATQMHKNRFGKHKGKMPEVSPAKAFTNQCGNMAYEVHLLLEHPALEFQHYQLKNQVGIDHHVLSVSHEGKTWVVDPSAEQFVSQITLPGIKQGFLENGFFNKNDTAKADSFLSFYSALGNKATFQDNFDMFLDKSKTATPYINDIEDAFVNDARKARRSFT